MRGKIQTRAATNQRLYMESYVISVKRGRLERAKKASLNITFKTLYFLSVDSARSHAFEFVRIKLCVQSISYFLPSDHLISNLNKTICFSFQLFSSESKSTDIAVNSSGFLIRRASPFWISSCKHRNLLAGSAMSRKIMKRVNDARRVCNSFAFTFF